MGGGDAEGPRSFADKLDQLFGSVQAHPGREYTHEEVARAISARGSLSISHTYIWQLRRGIKNNPSIGVVSALVAFFGVPPSYFLDDERTREMDTDLELLATLRDPGVGRLALRVAGLSADSIDLLLSLTEHLRRLEGVPDSAPVRAGRRRRRPDPEQPDA